MNRADTVKAAMNARQRFRCYRSEMLAYGFSVMPFRAWIRAGRPCNVHCEWKPGNDFLPRYIGTRGAWYPQKIHNSEW